MHLKIRHTTNFLICIMKSYVCSTHDNPTRIHAIRYCILCGYRKNSTKYMHNIKCLVDSLILILVKNAKINLKSSLINYVNDSRRKFYFYFYSSSILFYFLFILEIFSYFRFLNQLEKKFFYCHSQKRVF